MPKKVYLVTDSRPNLDAIIKQYVELGIDYIQYRNKSENDQAFIDHVKLLTKMISGTKTKLVINDRVHLLPQLNVSSLHVGQEDLKNILTLPQNYEIGISVVNVQEAQRALALKADWLGVGPLFPTQTKKVKQYVDPETLAKIHHLTPKIIIIGGLDATSILAVNPLHYQMIAASAFLLDHTQPAIALQTLRRADLNYLEQILHKLKFKFSALKLEDVQADWLVASFLLPSKRQIIILCSNLTVQIQLSAKLKKYCLLAQNNYLICQFKSWSILKNLN